MKNKGIISWLSSSILLLLILMVNVSACTKLIPRNPFAQTNKGRDVVAYRIGKDKKVQSFNFKQIAMVTRHSSSSGVVRFSIECHSGITLHVSDYDMFKVGKKYLFSDKLDGAAFKAFAVELKGYCPFSACLEFRYFQDGIAAGNFEAVLVTKEEPRDTLKITDGTFDVKLYNQDND